VVTRFAASTTHGQVFAAQKSPTTVSRSNIRLIQHFDSSAHSFGLDEVALNQLFPHPLITLRPSLSELWCVCAQGYAVSPGPAESRRITWGEPTPSAPPASTSLAIIPALVLVPAERPLPSARPDPPHGWDDASLSVRSRMNSLPSAPQFSPPLRSLFPQLFPAAAPLVRTRAQACP
jgi:hypothetical protein